MAYRLSYSDYSTTSGPPDPAEWVGPPGPVGPVGPPGPPMAAIVSDTAPSAPNAGQLWFDSSSPQLYLWYSDPNSAQWVIATANAGGLSADAPVDGNVYGRSNAAWTLLPSSVVVPPGGSIQAAHDALPATGGSILLSANTTYVVSTTINLTKPNVHISAPSWGTIVRRDPAYTSDVLIQGTGADCVIEGFTVDGNSVVTSVMELGVSGSNSLVRNMQIINGAGSGHLTLAGNNSRATGNRIIGLGTLLSTERGYGIWAINHQTVMIDHNTVSGTGIDGIAADGDGSQIIGNRVFGCHTWTGGPGGQIGTYPTSGGGIGNGIAIIGNTVGPGGSAFAHGIELGAANSLAAGNVVDGVGGYGILIVSGGVTITGNYIRNVGSNTLDGIEILAGLSDFVITGNRIADDRATPVMRAGIWINAGASNRYVITDNLITGAVTGPLADQGTGHNKTIGRNIGIDDVIPLISPTSPLTLPLNPVIYLLGSVTITSMGTTNPTGQTVTLITQGPTTFVAGATIVNGFVSTANVPFSGVFDGAQWRFWS